MASKPTTPNGASCNAKQQKKTPGRAQAKPKKPQKNAAKLPKKSVGKPGDFRMQYVCTIGTVAAPGEGLNRAASTFLSPVLVKDFATDSKQANQPNTTSSMYSEYRVVKSHLTAYPLVGYGGVSGCMLALHYVEDSSNGAAQNFDMILTGGAARGTVGKEVVKHGGQTKWYPTDATGVSTPEALGPRFDAYTYGQAMNVYTNTQFTGELWRLVLTIEFEFRRPRPNPDLANMAVDRGVELTMSTNTSGELVAEVATPVGGLLDPATNGGLADCIWGLWNVGASLLSNIPLVSEIARAGTLFLRPLAGNSPKRLVGNDAAQHQYLVCRTFGAANGEDGLNPGATITKQAVGPLVAQQLTPTPSGSAVARSVAPQPGPVELPSDLLRSPATPGLGTDTTPGFYIMLPGRFTLGTSQKVPTQATNCVIQTDEGQYIMPNGWIKWTITLQNLTSYASSVTYTGIAGTAGDLGSYIRTFPSPGALAAGLGCGRVISFSWVTGFPGQASDYVALPVRIWGGVPGATDETQAWSTSSDRSVLLVAPTLNLAYLIFTNGATSQIIVQGLCLGSHRYTNTISPISVSRSEGVAPRFPEFDIPPDFSPAPLLDSEEED